MEGKDEWAVYNNYESTLEFVTNSSILPSIEELDDYMANSLMVQKYD